MDIAALALSSVSLVFAVGFWAVARRELRALVPVAAQQLKSALHVVIPARNEPDIAVCLRAVLADPAASLRVVVVDDRSSDDTAARAQAVCDQDSRARVVRLTTEPADGVFGKPRALDAGVQALDADAQLLCFLDADVVLAPGALGGLVHAMAAQGAGAVSGVVRLVTRGLVEQLLVPTFASVVMSRMMPTAVHDATHAAAFLNGQLIVTSRAALEGIGGWRAMSGTVLEDVALARKLKAHGTTLRLCDVRALAATRMYTSLADIVAGFKKNAVALLGPWAGVTGVSALALSLNAWLAAALAVHAMRDGRITLAVVTLASVALTCACGVSVRHQARVARWPALVLPVAYVVVAWVLLSASLGHARKRPLLWKGRSYPRGQ